MLNRNWEIKIKPKIICCYTFMKLVKIKMLYNTECWWQFEEHETLKFGECQVGKIT